MAKSVSTEPTYMLHPRSPRVQHNTRHNNAACWESVVAAVKKAGNKGATMTDLKAALPETNRAFAGYAVRRGWLVPAA